MICIYDTWDPRYLGWHLSAQGVMAYIFLAVLPREHIVGLHMDFTRRLKGRDVQKHRSNREIMT